MKFSKCVVKFETFCLDYLVRHYKILMTVLHKVFLFMDSVSFSCSSFSSFSSFFFTHKPGTCTREC